MGIEFRKLKNPIVSGLTFLNLFHENSKWLLHLLKPFEIMNSFEGKKTWISICKICWLASSCLIYNIVAFLFLWTHRSEFDMGMLIYGIYASGKSLQFTVSHIAKEFRTMQMEEAKAE